MVKPSALQLAWIYNSISMALKKLFVFSEKKFFSDAPPFPLTARI